MVPSPPLDAVELPITVGVPPLQMVWPVVRMAPVVNAVRTVTVQVPVDTVGVVVQVPSLAYLL